MEMATSSAETWSVYGRSSAELQDMHSFIAIHSQHQSFLPFHQLASQSRRCRTQSSHALVFSSTISMTCMRECSGQKTLVHTSIKKLSF